MTSVNKVTGAISQVADFVQSDEFEQFKISAKDFISARERAESPITQITQSSAEIDDAPAIVNQNFSRQDQSGQYTNIISPVVIPKSSRSYFWVFWFVVLAVIGIIGLIPTIAIDWIDFTNIAGALFGLHYWILLAFFVLFNLWKNSFVMIPDGCKALITQFGKLESIADAGRVWLFNPWKKVSYIVNTTKEYPYNAPVREAPTANRVNASVDLFLQFRVEDPAEFIFSLGGTQGFTEKLENAISEVTRALIYEQKAEEIYDLVGESTQSLLDALNRQFLPAVRFVNANITHAEPSSQQYRMDMAAPEMVRVAKEAYTYEYELKLRKEQDEGDLNKELASLRETLSGIRAEIAQYQAQMDTAREREINRANAYARQLMVEVESEARANAALLEAQALDIRAMNSAHFPEILDYRYQQNILKTIEAIAARLPQMVRVGHIGKEADPEIDFMEIAKQMLGISNESLFNDNDMQTIRSRVHEVSERIKERTAQINAINEAARKDNQL